MKTKDELKENYILAQTKGWDDETKERYISNVEDDFETWYKGYSFALKELANEALPILEFTKGKIDSSAGIFQQSVTMLIQELHTQAGRV